MRLVYFAAKNATLNTPKGTVTVADFVTEVEGDLAQYLLRTYPDDFAYADAMTAVSPPGVQLAGDLDGDLESPQVVGLRGVPLAETEPAAGQVLTFSDNAWRPADAASGGVELQEATPGVAQTGNVHLTGKMIADDSVRAGAGTGGVGSVEMTGDSDGGFLAGVNVRDGNGNVRTRIKDRRWQAWDQPGASGGTNTLDLSADEAAPYVKVTASGGDNAALKHDGIYINGVRQGTAAPKASALDANHTDSWLMNETSGTSFANEVPGRPALVAAQASDWTPRNSLFTTRTNPEATCASGTPLRATGLALPGHTGSLTVEWFFRYPYGNGTNWISLPFWALSTTTWGASDNDLWASAINPSSGFYNHGRVAGAAKDFAGTMSDRLSSHHAMAVYTRNGTLALWLDGVSLNSLACGSFSAPFDRLEVAGWSSLYATGNSVQISNIRISNIARDAAYAAQVQACLRAG